MILLNVQSEKYQANKTWIEPGKYKTLLRIAAIATHLKIFLIIFIPPVIDTDIVWQNFQQ